MHHVVWSDGEHPVFEMYSIHTRTEVIPDYAGGNGGMHGVICMHQRISGMGAIPVVAHHLFIEHQVPDIVHDAWCRSGLWTLPKA